MCTYVIDSTCVNSDIHKYVRTYSVNEYAQMCIYMFICNRLYVCIHWHPSSIGHVGRVVRLWGTPHAYSPTLPMHCEIVWGLGGQSTGGGLIWSSSTNGLPHNYSNDWHSSCCDVRHRTYNQNKHCSPIPTKAMCDSCDPTLPPWIMDPHRHLCIYIYYR